LKIQFEIPWQDLTGRPLPVAVNPGAYSEGADGLVLFGEMAFTVECDSSGALLVNFPLALFLRSLMAAAPEVRGFVLDTIGRTEAGKVRPELVAHILDAIGVEACKLHFGLVELSQPKGGA